MRIPKLLLAAVALVAAGAPASAPALDRTVSMVSSGDLHEGGEEGGGAASFEAASTDFRRIVFVSAKPFTAGDPDDGVQDVFVREDDTIRILSVGPGPLEPQEPQDPRHEAEFQAASPDARRVLWSTREDVTPDDVDRDGLDGRDLYLTENGETRLVSTGPRTQGDADATFGGASRELRRIVFITSDPLVPEDGDTTADVYLRSGTTTTLVSYTPHPSTADDRGARDSKVSADGRHIFFTSRHRMTPTDTDDQLDGFEWHDGELHQVTIGPAGGNGPVDVGEYSVERQAIARISPDGSRAWFYTTERLTHDDRDSRMDLYERSGGSTRLISIGPAGGNGEFDVGDSGRHGPEELGLPGRLYETTPDGRRVFFGTYERLTKDDRDDLHDVYLRRGGKTTLVTPAGRGKTGAVGSAISAISSDGRRAILISQERLTRDDKDDSIDVFAWTDGGAVRRLSFGPRGGNADKPYEYVGALPVRPTSADVDAVTPDARVVFFSTGERLTSDDRDKRRTLYESRAGRVSPVTVRGTRGKRESLVGFGGGYAISPDGRDFAFETTAPLSRGDNDEGNFDVYLARLR